MLNLDYPGVFDFTPLVYCGSSNKDYYKGKVVVLINENTQRRAEYAVMALMTAPMLR